jgi:hypothetical protein
MAFTLQVDFSGLCVYVEHETIPQVAILLPDARELLPAKGPHQDGTLGQAHVGYLRFNLADCGIAVPPGLSQSPYYEVVHRFDRDLLEFVVTGTDQPLTVNPMVPRFEGFAPDRALGGKASLLVPADGVFTSTPPVELLMRTVLTGGTLAGNQAREDWFFVNLFDSGQRAYRGIFSNVVTWTRRVESVSLRLTNFEGLRPAVEIPLNPASAGPDAVVRVKVANFCATNPLEWEELGLRQVGQDDEDFKWLYRLLKPRTGTWDDLLKGQRLPIPLIPAFHSEGVEDCLGGHTTTVFP